MEFTKRAEVVPQRYAHGDERAASVVRDRMSEGDPDVFEDDDLLAEDREEEEREECVQDCLELILERVNSHLDASELQRKVVSYAASQAVRDALAVVDMTFVERESFSTRGPATEPEETVGSWFPDEAHIPAPIDAWARGTVRARRRPRVPEQENPRAAVGSGAKLSATMGAPRVGVGVGGGSLLRKTGGARLSSTMPRKSFPAAIDAPKAKPLRSKQKMTPEEMNRERRLREEIGSRRAAQELQKLQVQKDQYELRKLESLQKSMRGQDWGYAESGELVVVQKLDPEKMPSFAQTMKVKVIDQRETAEEASTRKLHSLTTKRLGGVDYVHPKQSQQQANALEVMTMARGVTLRHGASAKAGPPLLSSTQDMSKGDYMDLVAAKSSVSRRASSTTTTPRARASAQQVVTVDPNFALLGAKDWGVNPPSAMKMKPYQPPTEGIPKARTPLAKTPIRR